VRVTLGQDESGGARDLGLGDEITIVLDENPTTGYRWHPDIDAGRLQLTDDQYQGAQRPVGAGGTRQMTFVPLQAGRARLHLVKRRSWEQAVIAEFDLALDVRAD
jgi:inhibitor of cysteine peptidase